MTLPKISNYRIKSLDGIRGVSILMVLLAHGSTSLPKSITNNFVYSILANGHTGVMIFFVISGYLITKLLLIEKEKKGEISIKDFYVRRFFRIFPVFYLYIGIVIILKNTILPDIFTNYATVLFSAFYFWNYKHLLLGSFDQETNGNWFMGHLWSLSMEEQFYLIWPLAFKKISPETLKKIVIALLLLMPILRVSTYFYFPSSRGQVDMMLHTGGDTILTGCLGALLEKSEKFMNLLKNLLSKIWIVIAAFIYLLIIDGYLNERFRGGYSIPIGHSFNNFIILFLILWCIHVPSFVHNFLNYKWISQIGVISYSLYIWQQLILTNIYPSTLNSFPINFIIVFAIAFASYYLIEKPILKFKNSFKHKMISVHA
jgi:peptidoglycan/LPS O-acetylase OafA/YrhL